MAQETKAGSSGGTLRRILVIVLFGLIVLIGLNVLFYPQLSNYINEKNQSRVITGYDQKVAQLSSQDYSQYLAAAQAYNASLASGGTQISDAFQQAADDKSRKDPYWSLLKLDSTGVMGYLVIDKIKVNLPIYHGTDAGVLAAGVGHLQGSSLPVGGESTHAVLSAHTGLPSAELFTNLDQLAVGDTFAVHILGNTLTYQVDQILTVLPDEVDALSITPGKDYLTLVTCTPYGINSHRLLVRGVRIGNPADSQTENSPAVQQQTQAAEQNGFQKILHSIFVAFADAFEAVITFVVKMSRLVMGWFGIAY
jgi:sortase A